MTTNYLEWLALSTPASPQEIQVEPGQQPCPICGWPLDGAAEICPHCRRPLTGASASDGLAALGIQLPPPVEETVPYPTGWFAPDTPLAAPGLYHLRLQAERLRVTTGFDRLICLDDINVDHYQHQLDAALRVLRDMRGRALLADEVGLGKTIEAGIVMKELIERGLVSSVLIITPASLTWQWHEEMETKFHEDFTVLEDITQLPDTPPAGPRRLIISLSRARSEPWAGRLLNASYDLLIVDEAHKLKNQRTRAYQFVNQIRKQYVLLLTATPVHNHLMELYNLITILRPGHLGTRRAFRANFIKRADTRAHRRTIYSSAHPDAYLRQNAYGRRRYRFEHSGNPFAARTENFDDIDTLRLDSTGQSARDEVKRLLQLGYSVTDFEAIQPGFLSRHQFVCRLQLTDPAAAPAALRPAITPNNPAALRQLLREVMVRNRRTSVGMKFSPRRAAIYAFDLTPPERQLYDSVTDYIRRQLREQAGDDVSPGALRMSLLSLQKQLGSSPAAAARSLRNMVDRQPDNSTLAEALVLAWDIRDSRKLTATLQLLADHPGKFLIFTDYLPTLDMLVTALNEAGIETVAFHGGLSATERVEAIRRFRTSARVMVSTQSGSEGHNLQFCHQLINYDLPWNPMRIEQRVGRLHRLGQQEAVTIFNLSANNTIEAYVLDLLARKIRMFELVIGEMDLILGHLDEQRGFEQRIEEAWADSLTEVELARMVAQLEDVLAEAQTEYSAIRSASDELSDLLDAIDEVYPP
jgi:SNF2 family DNA or RNA helicase